MSAVFWRAGFLALCALAGTAASLKADDYPSRPVRIVLGFTAGGPTDIPARFLADRLSTALGRPVVVENKPGAGAMLAANEVLSRSREGYDLLLCTYFDAVNTLLYRSVKYKLADIVGVSLIARYSYAVAVANAIPVQSFTELVQYAKAHPDALNYGHLGAGSTQNLIAKRLEKLAGMKMTAIPYKGSAEAMQEIVGGRNHMFIGPPLSVMPLYQAKQVKVLAVTGAERLASMPEVPTLKESGLPLVAYAWLGVCAGAGTPPAVIVLLNREIGAIVRSSEYRELIEKAGSIALASTPEELGHILRETYEQTARIAREFNLHL